MDETKEDFEASSSRKNKNKNLINNGHVKRKEKLVTKRRGDGIFVKVACVRSKLLFSWPFYREKSHLRPRLTIPEDEQRGTTYGLLIDPNEWTKSTLISLTPTIEVPKLQNLAFSKFSKHSLATGE